MNAAGSLVTTSGERYDFILNADQEIGNYWMKFRGLADCDEKFNSAFNVAVLHYDTAPDKLPDSVVTYASIVPTGLVSFTIHYTISYASDTMRKSFVTN